MLNHHNKVVPNFLRSFSVDVHWKQPASTHLFSLDCCISICHLMPQAIHYLNSVITQVCTCRVIRQQHGGVGKVREGAVSKRKKEGGHIIPVKQGNVDFLSLADHYKRPCRLWKFWLDISSTEKLYSFPEVNKWKSSYILELWKKNSNCKSTVTLWNASIQKTTKSSGTKGWGGTYTH